MSDLYDLSFLKQMLDDNEEELKTMVKMFVELSPQTFKEIQEAANNGNWVSAGDLAHKLKSSLRIMGLNDLAKTALVIETEGRNNRNFSEIKNKIKELDESLSAVVEAMRADFGF